MMKKENKPYFEKHSYSFKMIWSLFFVIGLLLNFTGCASPDTDRSLVNDPQMQLGIQNNLQGLNKVSPLTGLRNRNKANGGTACSTCAH